MSAGHALRGRILERAISRAGVQYRKDGLGEVWKQETPAPIWTERGEVRPGSAPIDFRGTMAGGRAIAIEAKLVSSGGNFPLDKWTERQRSRFAQQHRLGAWTRLIVAFDEHNETFAIDWPPIDSFLRNPWRESLSLDWCRAYGELVPDGPRLDPQARSCRFLESRQHDDKALALARVLEERSKALLREARKPERPPKAPSPQPAPFTSLTRREQSDRIFEATIIGLTNAGKRQRRRRF